MNRIDLREALHALETRSPELERRYRERLKAIFERRLTGVEKISIAAGLLLALWLVFRFVQLLVRVGAQAPLAILASLAVGLAFSIGMVVFSVWQLQGGTEDVRRHGLARAQLVSLFTLAMALLMLWAGIEARDSAIGIRLILAGLVTWCAIGLPFYLTHLVRQSELRLRAELLGIELALAEAAERKEARP
jgi:hypothetical protein